MKEKIFSKWGIAISLTLIYVIISVLAIQLNVVVYSGFGSGNKTYLECGNNACNLRTTVKGIKYCSCEEKPGRAKIECCEQAAKQQTTPASTVPAAAPAAAEPPKTK